ncbi:hypothetical protein Tco_0386172 [Tanacetum coccineum]
MLGSSLKLTDFATLVLLRYTLTSGLGVIMGVWLVSLGGTMGLEVILVKGHFVPLIVKVLPVDCDPLALVEGITPVEDNKSLLVVCLTTEQTTSFLANNAELKAQIQEKVFAIAALKNDLRKLKGNSVDTKFDKNISLGETGYTITKKPISC